MKREGIEFQYDGVKLFIGKNRLKEFYEVMNELSYKVKDFTGYHDFERFYSLAEKYFQAPINLWGIDSSTFELLEEIEDSRNHNCRVLILGETGTGKELLAKAIHYAKNEDDIEMKRFIDVNCAGIPEALLESELFGYKKGAHNTAFEDKDGLIKRAEGGTLFLDEIGEMLPGLQAKLLRFLIDKEFWPLGAKTPEKSNCRIICATNVDISRSDIRRNPDKFFRGDFFYRIGERIIRLEPISNEIENLNFIIFIYLKLLFKKYKVKGKLRSVSGIDMYKYYKYSWEGNYRELLGELESYSIRLSRYSKNEWKHLRGSNSLNLRVTKEEGHIKRNMRLIDLMKKHPKEIISLYKGHELKGDSSVNSKKTVETNIEHNLSDLAKAPVALEEVKKLYVEAVFKRYQPDSVNFVSLSKITKMLGLKNSTDFRKYLDSNNIKYYKMK